MGSVRKRGAKWYIDYRCNGKRYIESIGPSKKSAQNVLHKRLTEIAEGKHLDKRDLKPLLFKDFSQDYITKYSKVNKRSWRDDVSRLKKLNRFFGEKCLHEITPEMIEEYKSRGINGFSPATVNRELACMKHLYTIAIKWGKVTRNPVKDVKLFKESNSRLRYLEFEETERLIGNCEGYLRALVIIAVNTGMRRGEIFNLQWEHIDLKRKIVYLIETKNGEKREIPMNDRVARTLFEIPQNADISYVFHNRHGKPFTSVKKSFATALSKAGISAFRFHDLRHTFASHLAMKGIDLNTIRELLGHKSMRMTLRYAHLNQEHKQRAVDVLSEKWLQNGNNSPKEIFTKKETLSKLFKQVQLQECASE